LANVQAVTKALPRLRRIARSVAAQLLSASLQKPSARNADLADKYDKRKTPDL
jgi:hypothetical protein